LECADEEVYKGKAEGEGCSSGFDWLYDCYTEGQESYDAQTWIGGSYKRGFDLFILRLLQYAVVV
jgi:hypothetical protein